jgi:Domain of unknown function (DUF4136)
MRIAAHVCFIVSWVLLGASHHLMAGQQKYGVTVQTAKAPALAKVKTYVWDGSRQSFDKDVDTLIVAAVDRELAARGFTKLPSGQSDVVVRYASLSRTDTDLKSKPSASGERRSYAVGSLVVDLSGSTDRQVLFRVRMDTPIERDPATIGATIDGAVAAMFAKYPTPSKR